MYASPPALVRVCRSRRRFLCASGVKVGSSDSSKTRIPIATYKNLRTVTRVGLLALSGMLSSGTANVAASISARSAGSCRYDSLGECAAAEHVCIFGAQTRHKPTKGAGATSFERSARPGHRRIHSDHVPDTHVDDSKHTEARYPKRSPAGDTGVCHEDTGATRCES